MYLKNIITWSNKVEKQTNESAKAFLKDRKPGLFVNFDLNMYPDPGQPNECVLIHHVRIRIHNTGLVAGLNEIRNVSRFWTFLQTREISVA